MKLEFEKWYEEKINNEEAKQLFREGCLCYKVGAYRAAFLITYLGLQNILKERLLKLSSCPNNISEELWERTKKDLMNDKKWDEAVFDCVKRVNPSNIFLINDDIRKQYDYFRCIRNDCAHAKSNIISYPHVESLWLFIQSNNNKFVVNGGKAGLLDRINIHYNPIYTKPGADINPIIEDIPTAMSIDEIPTFLEEVYEVFDSFASFTDEEYFDFWNQIVHSENNDLRRGMFVFVKKEWNVFLDFIDAFPETVIEILSTTSDEFKREFWKTHLLKMRGCYYENRWKIVKTIISNNIIPSDELSDFISALSRKYNEMPPEEYIDFYRTVGFIDEFKKSVFNTRNFSSPNGIHYANRNWKNIKDLITNIELDNDIVLILNKVFLRTSYGKFYEGMKRLLEENINFKAKYKQILSVNNCEIPEYLSELDEINE